MPNAVTSHKVGYDIPDIDVSRIDAKMRQDVCASVREVHSKNAQNKTRRTVLKKNNVLSEICTVQAEI